MGTDCRAPQSMQQWGNSTPRRQQSAGALQVLGSLADTSTKQALDCACACLPAGDPAHAQKVAVTLQALALMYLQPAL